MKRGIRIICFGADGDPRILRAQKTLLSFGEFENFGPIRLAGSINSDFQASQDPYHIAKKMKNVLYDPPETLMMGTKFATLGHLIILAKKFSKHQHNLAASDLDVTLRMNYEYVSSIQIIQYFANIFF